MKKKHKKVLCSWSHDTICQVWSSRFNHTLVKNQNKRLIRPYKTLKDLISKINIWTAPGSRIIPEAQLSTLYWSKISFSGRVFIQSFACCLFCFSFSIKNHKMEVFDWTLHFNRWESSTQHQTVERIGITPYERRM